MLKVVILILVIGILLLRALWIVYNKRNANFLLISFFIIATAFQYSFAIISGAKTYIGGGAIGPDIRITVALILVFILLPFVRFKNINFRKNRWVAIIFLFIIVSFFNPLNESPVPSVAFIVFFASHIILFELFNSYLTREEIIKGLYDGFFTLSALQFPLAICFPFLGIKSVTIPFQVSGEETSTRNGQRDGAIGIFQHPGFLSLFILIATCFFLACYLKNYNKKISLLILVLNTFTLILTYSRTAYLVYVFDLAAVYFFYKNAGKPVLSFLNIIRFVLPVGLVLAWLIFYSPLSDNFLKSNIDEMADARLIFYSIAYDAFQMSPIIGVGINTHRDFLLHHSNLIKTFTYNPFFFENPIHNINLIVLVETGIIGFAFWIIFLVTSVLKAKTDIANKKNDIFSLSHIGVITAVVFYGMTGWAPFSLTILPFFLFFTYFTVHYRGT